MTIETISLIMFLFMILVAVVILISNDGRD